MLQIGIILVILPTKVAVRIFSGAANVDCITKKITKTE